MNVSGKTVLVTGANRGIGKAIVEELVRRGAATVFAGARNVDDLAPLVAAHGDVIRPIRLDVTSNEDVRSAADAIDGLDVLVNNAGIISNLGRGPLENIDGLRDEMEVNVFGPLSLASTFADRLAAGRGAVININSIASYFSFPPAATYSASKAAAHSLTMALRAHLGARDIQVLGVYPGPIDTDMAQDIEMEKESPQSVASKIFDALERGDEDLFPDAMAAQWHEQWKQDAKALEHEIGAMLTA